MEYLSTKRMESRSCPGVAYTIRKMTVARRGALEEILAPMRAAVREIRDSMAPVSREYREAVDAAKALVAPERDKLVAGGMGRAEAEKEVPLGHVDFSAEKLKALMAWGEDIGKLDREELTPRSVEFALVGIAGLTIDGEPATFAALLERGPDELYAEIAAAVAEELGLSPVERANLPSPSTSGTAVGGGGKPGSAARAETLVTITNEAAPSSTVLESASAAAIG